MDAMPHGDDLDARFNELVAQIDADERRRMRAAAAKGAKERGKAPRKPREARLYADAGPRPPRRLGRLSVALITLCAVVGAAGVVVTFRPDLLGANTGPVPEETVPVEWGPAREPVEESAEEPVEEEAAETVSVADPFAGSPAAGYAEGAKGFEMPKAKALGGLSKKDVAKGLERTRALLAAAFLDRQTLMGGRPAAFIKLLHPDEASWFKKGLGRKGAKSTRSWVISFAPKTAEPATGVIKVHGRSKLSAFRKDGRRGVKVATNYLVVYAVRRPGQPATTIRLVVHQRGTVLVHRDSRGLVTWIDDWGGSSTPARCDVKDGYVHPMYEDSTRDAERPAGDPIDPYDLERERQKGKCQAARHT